MNYLIGFVSGILIVLLCDSLNIIAKPYPVSIQDKLFILIVIQGALVFVAGLFYTKYKKG